MIDCHCHYDDHKFNDDRDEVLNNLFSSGVKYVIDSGVDKKSTENVIKLSGKFENLYFSAGLYPEYCDIDKKYKDWLIPALEHKKCVSLGEIGLDRHFENPPVEPQLALFREQLALAREMKKNVVIHDRDAHELCIKTVSEFPEVKGMFHSFSGSAEMAEALVKMGWYISFSGVITFKNAVKTVDAAKVVPLDRILTETDCPYLAPHPHRGERNHSGNIHFIIEKLAEIKGISPEKIEEITENNAKSFYGLSL